MRVIGIGSPHGDDALGWEAARYLARLPGIADHLRIDCLDRPGTGLIQAISGETAVILLDAMEAGLPAGTVRRLSADELMAGVGAVSSHALGVAESLALARVLGVLPNAVHIIGIQAGLAAPLGKAPRGRALATVSMIVREITGLQDPLPAARPGNGGIG
ncbi:hypothetical protein CKO35_02875 [Ectothiorhodospira shaposhnikovii]|uniref:hydrogenase maturation protease n=1 Tax=Ectothiorhodospira shaposhnikovii TaxID=1054 RepID=UPI00190424E2|nr:hydrogenase maturation protease [Ectothiorhodospira shaposhnikovii]MBK1672261.1 hypothetical protein [Ectothiorhodospira shaposhnikovii]